ncbi:MAG: hypothetical protein QGI45_10175 [Myxococcota bacterium]|jgi:hypothetical protein|nr:hypothetical protein [Myxococcota bacterium]
MIAQDRQFEAILHRQLDAQGAQRAVFERILYFWRLYNNISFRRYEPLKAELAVRLMLGGPISRLFQAVNETLPYVANFADHLDGVEVYDDDEELWLHTSTQLDMETKGAVDGMAKPKMDSFCEDIDKLFHGESSENLQQSAQQISIAKLTRGWCEEISSLVLRLHQSRRERSKWSLITEGSEAQKKLIKIIWGASLLSLNYFQIDHVDEVLRLENSELHKAKRIRRALFGFRDRCLEMVEQTVQARTSDKVLLIQEMLRSFEKLTQESIYTELRARDRFEMQKHRLALEKWQEGDWQNEEELNGFMNGLVDFLSSLSGLNRRQSLFEEDRSLQAECLKRFAIMLEDKIPEDSGHFVFIVESLKDLACRDAALHEFNKEFSKDCPPEDLREQLGDCHIYLKDMRIS